MPARLTNPLDERLFAKVVCDVHTQCWNWIGRCLNGYGTLTVAPQKEDRAHRVAYRLFVGPIPDGIHLHHKCENPRCCNPAHLQPVTPKEHNHLSPRNLAAIAEATTHCPQGHALVDGNLVPSRLKKGQRICLTCQRAAIRADYHKKKKQWKARHEERKQRDPAKWQAAQARYQAKYRARKKNAA